MEKLQELKALAFDLIAQRESISNQLNQTTMQIAKLQNEAKAEPTKPPVEHKTE